VRLQIPREQLTQQVGDLLSRFDVLDLEVGDPPVEELIGRLFRQGSVA
jgi:ABC-2 type transport system ATP-binding protein